MTGVSSAGTHPARTATATPTPAPGPAATPFAVSAGVTLLAFDRPHTRRLHEEIFSELVYEVGDLGQAPVIVDCGAHIGFATAWFIGRHPGCRVIALEPEPDALALLRGNAASQGWTRARVIGAAAATAAGSVAYYIDPDRPAHPRSSLLPERMSGRRITVPAVRLADELGGEGAIDLLKMDVEGAEAALLADLARTGRLRQVRNIAVEFHHNLRGAGRLSRTLQLLEDAGFRYTLRARRHGDCASFQNVMVYAGRTEPA
jgi:FkbM family methyltransferase